MRSIEIKIPATESVARETAQLIRCPKKSIHAQYENGDLRIVCPTDTWESVEALARRLIKTHTEEDS